MFIFVRSVTKCLHLTLILLSDVCSSSSYIPFYNKGRDKQMCVNTMSCLLLWCFKNKCNCFPMWCSLQWICYQGTMCMWNGSEIVMKKKMKWVSISTLMWWFEKIQLWLDCEAVFLIYQVTYHDFLAYCNRSRRPHSAHLLLTAVYPVQQLTSRGQQRRYYGQQQLSRTEPLRGHWGHGYLGNGFK